jgi:hypothetical protein
MMSNIREKFPKQVYSTISTGKFGGSEEEWTNLYEKQEDAVRSVSFAEDSTDLPYVAVYELKSVHKQELPPLGEEV